jgi:hypothetical protein
LVGNPVTSGSSGAERFERSGDAELMREHLRYVDRDRPKRIDLYIDYFGSRGELAPPDAPRGGAG